MQSQPVERLDRDAVVTFCVALADAYIAGDLDRVADAYVHPLAMYGAGKVLLELTRAQTKRAMFARRAAALSAGTAMLEVQIREIGDLSTGRFRIRLDWHYRDAAGAHLATAELRYFCAVQPDGAIRIELIEVLKPGFSLPLDAWQEADPGAPPT